MNNIEPYYHGYNDILSICQLWLDIEANIEEDWLKYSVQWTTCLML